MAFTFPIFYMFFLLILPLGIEFPVKNYQAVYFNYLRFQEKKQLFLFALHNNGAESIVTLRFHGLNTQVLVTAKQFRTLSLYAR